MKKKEKRMILILIIISILIMGIIWIATKPKKEKVVDKSMQVIYDDISEKLKTQLGTKVNIVPKEDGSGKIEIEFYSHDELDRILDLMK